MTRINLVPVGELSDQHIVAEYRELFMIGASLQRSLRSPKWNPNDIPKKFTLNTGHVRFFYNKGLYLDKRYSELRAEMIRRGMSPNPERIFKKEQWPAWSYKDWIPSEEDMNIVRKRIEERIKKRPNWYRWTKYD